ATLFWGAIAGVPGILAHRGANTLDAMVGHRNERCATFGTASARLDDALGWIPARLTGVLACVAAPLVGGSTTRAWR
ncbi:cobalamin biosynthesis protein, partial [Escherichia coli]|uniref:cobalamin biosynthesis protein n=1 Tax=Escherichia coli TaxID=562 RepID=UPI00196839A4